MEAVAGWKRLFGIKDRSSAALAGFSLALLALHSALVVMFLAPRIGSLRFLRLHYSAEFGIDWVGGWWNLLFFPALGAAAFCINGLAAGRVSEKRPQFALAVLYSSACVEVALAAASVIVMLLNG